MAWLRNRGHNTQFRFLWSLTWNRISWKIAPWKAMNMWCASNRMYCSLGKQEGVASCIDQGDMQLHQRWLCRVGLNARPQILGPRLHLHTPNSKTNLTEPIPHGEPENHLKFCCCLLFVVCLVFSDGFLYDLIFSFVFFHIFSWFLLRFVHVVLPLSYFMDGCLCPVYDFLDGALDPWEHI